MEKKGKKKSEYFLVRTYSAGVFAGNIISRKGKETKIANARRIHYWDGAASLSQLAVDGTSKPEKCRFPVEVPEIIVTETIEILKVSPKGEKSIKAVPIWRA